MKVVSVAIKGDALQVCIEKTDNGALEYSLCVRERHTEGEVRQVNGRFTEGCATVKLEELHKNGYYWDLYLVHGTQETKLAIDKDDTGILDQKNIEFREKEYACIRLYTNAKGEIFLKRVYQGAAYIDNKNTISSLQEFLTGEHFCKKGSRYVELNCDGNGKVRLSFFEYEDFAGDEAALVCISESTEEKYIFPATGANGTYEADITGITKKVFTERETFAVYFAAAVSGRYYLLRLKEKTEESGEATETSRLIRNETRYKTPFTTKENTFVIYRGLYTEAFSAIVDDRVACEFLLKEGYRITSEKMDKPYKFRFSIVMAVYNVENYLEEAVESVLAQDIGFKSYIQLILVDDGSTDNSGKLCEQFAARYPKNIVVVHKENGGAASARNEGKKYAEGKYVNFMDPDDKISPDVCSKVWAFFDENQDKVDVVAFPIRFFGAVEDEYWQNYKFEAGSRVIDLYEEYTVSDMNTAASFIKNSVVQKHEFDGRIPVGEDLKYLLYILMDKMKLGVVTDCWYYYRRREGSLITSAHGKKGYYFDYMRYLVEEVQQYCLKEYGYIPYYVQNTLMMDLQWRLLRKEIDEQTLTAEEVDEYKKMLAKALKNIDDAVILSQRKLYSEHIHQALMLKYERRPETIRMYKDILYKYGNTVFKRESEMSTVICAIEMNMEYLMLEGYSNMLEIQEEDEIVTYISIEGVLTRCDKGTQEKEKSNFIGKLCHCEPFLVKIPIHAGTLGKKIYLYHTINGHVVARHNFTFAPTLLLDKSLKQQYFVKDGLALRREGASFIVEKCETKAERKLLEDAFCVELKELCDKKKEAGLEDEAAAIESALKYRKEYFKPRLMRKKKNDNSNLELTEEELEQTFKDAYRYLKDLCHDEVMIKE